MASIRAEPPGRSCWRGSVDPVGLVQGYQGESVPFTRVATIVFPTVITLWVAWMSVRLLRRGGARADRQEGELRWEAR